MYDAGLTAQGCWDEMDEYDRQAIMKFAHLIIDECCELIDAQGRFLKYTKLEQHIRRHFGVEK